MDSLKKLLIIFVLLCFNPASQTMEDPGLPLKRSITSCPQEILVEQLRETLAQKIFQEVWDAFLELKNLLIKFHREGLLNPSEKAAFLRLQKRIDSLNLNVNRSTPEEEFYNQIREVLQKLDLPALIAIQKKFFPVIKKKQLRKQ